GSAFLDMSVPTTEAQGVSVFASRDEQLTHVVPVLLNLQPETADDAEIDVLAWGGRFTRRVFEYRDGMAAFVGSESKDDGQMSRPGLVREPLQPASIQNTHIARAKH